MYKVIFSYKQDSPRGGNTRSSGWTEECKLYDGTLLADELQSKIDEFLNDDKCGYRKHITVKSIERL